MRCHLVLALAAVAGLLACNHETRQSTPSAALAPTAPRECESLTSLTLPNTTIDSAQTVGAGAFTPPQPAFAPPGPSPFASMPAFCRVAGTIRPTSDSDIKFEVWLPSSGWNGKYVGVGNGVWAGTITYSAMAEPLTRGYATASTDTGHVGDGLSVGFAAGHPEKLVDFGYRAVHETTVNAKAIVAAFYGSAVKRSLWVSCSTGGRQGLMEATRFPHDFDAISAMAPANPMVSLMIGSQWSGYAALKDPPSQVPPPKFAVVRKAVLNACDAKDGIKDNIVNDPNRCSFDPDVLRCKAGDAPDCLTDAQVETMRAIYRGPVSARGASYYPGFEPGSEGLLTFLVGGPQPFPVSNTFFGLLVRDDPNWDFRNFDLDKDAASAARFSPILDAQPNLGAFADRGGKLLLSHGWTDGVIPARSTIKFYEAAVKKLGARRASQSVRLFMMPGVAHCAGGEGPFIADMIGTLEHWADTNVAPAQIIASRPPGPDGQQMSRPLCPYPKIAKHKGTGSTDDAAHFECAAP